MGSLINKKKFITHNVLVFSMLVCLFLTTKKGETAVTGKISGLVREEQTSKTLVNVRVALLDMSRVTLTNQAGEYVFVGLHPGQYDIEIDLNGYRSIIKEEVQVDIGLTTTVDFWLEKSTKNQPTVTKDNISGFHNNFDQNSKLINAS